MKHLIIAVLALVMVAALLTGCGCMNTDATYPTILPTTPKPTQAATTPTTAATTRPTTMPTTMPTTASTDATNGTAGADGVVPETTTESTQGARGRSHMPGAGR